MIMSVSDGGSPWVAQSDASTASAPSGTWTVRVRNTGTSASSGTTTVEFDAGATGYFLPSAGQDWTCTDTWGSHPVLQQRCCGARRRVAATADLPWASLPRYGYAYAKLTLANASDGTIGNDTLSIHTAVVEPTSSIDVVASVSDGEAPFTAGNQAVYTVTVRNVGTSSATGDVTVHYPTPFNGMAATGADSTCTASTAADPTCTHPGGLAAGSSLPPGTVTGTVPTQDAPATVRAEVSVDNSSDAFTNDNYTYLDTGITTFQPVKLIYGSPCPDVMVLAVRGPGCRQRPAGRLGQGRGRRAAGAGDGRHPDRSHRAAAGRGCPAGEPGPRGGGDHPGH
jgi:hypothetical protein